MTIDRTTILAELDKADASIAKAAAAQEHAENLLQQSIATVQEKDAEIAQLRQKIEELTQQPTPEPTPGGEPAPDIIVRQGESLTAAFGDDKYILFHGRHVLTNTASIGRKNMRLRGAPGDNTLVKGAGGDFNVLRTTPGSSGIILEGINFETETDGHGRAVNVSGTDITIRDCTAKGLKEFVKLDQASPPKSVNVLNNKTETRAYGVYLADCEDVLIDGNTIADCSLEHCVRGNGRNIRITNNHLARKKATVTKTNLALQRVDNVLVKGNTFVTFPAAVGPETSRPADRATNVRFEGNTFQDAQLEINEGSNDIAATGNKLSSKGVRIRTNGGTNGGVNRVSITGNTSPLDESKLVTIDDRGKGGGWVKGLKVEGNVKQ